MVGTTGRSNALLIAERLGMPSEVLDTARSYVSPQARETEALLAELARERATAEDARARALKEAAEAATLKVRARGLLRDAEKRHREVWEQAQASADEELADLRREAHRVRLQLQSARTAGAGEVAREAVESALTLPGISAPALPAALDVPAAPEVPEAARIQLGAEVLVPPRRPPGRGHAGRGDTVDVSDLGRPVCTPRSQVQ